MKLALAELLIFTFLRGHFDVVICVCVCAHIYMYVYFFLFLL